MGTSLAPTTSTVNAKGVVPVPVSSTVPAVRRTFSWGGVLRSKMSRVWDDWPSAALIGLDSARVNRSVFAYTRSAKTSAETNSAIVPGAKTAVPDRAE